MTTGREANQRLNPAAALAHLALFGSVARTGHTQAPEMPACVRCFLGEVARHSGFAQETATTFLARLSSCAVREVVPGSATSRVREEIARFKAILKARVGRDAFPGINEQVEHALFLLGVGLITSHGQLKEAGVSHLESLAGTEPATDITVPPIEEESLADIFRQGAPLALQLAKSGTRSTKTDQLRSIIEELNALTGLANVKAEVLNLINLARVRELRRKENLPELSMSLHLLFTGNPGTGKTTVARIIGKIYHTLGLVSNGHVVEVDRSGLVAGYIGHTGPQVNDVLDQAEGGVLFIDEAYTLASEDSAGFAKEAVAALLKGMEDRRGNLVVIAAGYTDLMSTFLNSNPGLKSRFGTRIEFPDYDGGELFEIFKGFAAEKGYVIDAAAEPYVRGEIEEMHLRRSKHFGNARDVRKLFERVTVRQAGRISELVDPARADLVGLIDEDFSISA